jgi:hypothetical protein
MSIKSVGNFSPALQPHADWVDKNLGNKDGQLDAQELQVYKLKYPDATMFEPLNNELAAVTGQAAVTKTEAKGGAVNVGGGGGVLGFLLAQKGAVAAGTTTAQTASTGVRQSLPMDSLTKIGASSAGDVFQLDADSVATMSVRARQVIFPERTHMIPHFDCRAWQVPTLQDALDVFVWREDDALRKRSTHTATSTACTLATSTRCCTPRVSIGTTTLRRSSAGPTSSAASVNAA